MKTFIKHDESCTCPHCLYLDLLMAINRVHKRIECADDLVEKLAFERVRIQELESAMQGFVDMMENPATCDIPECYTDEHYFKFKELLEK